MDIPGLEAIATITRADFNPPIFQLITIKQSGESYVQIGNDAICLPDNVEKAIMDHISDRMLNIMLSLDRKETDFADRLNESRVKEVGAKQPLELFSELSNSNTLYIDQYLNNHSSLKNTVIDFCENTAGITINPNYPEDFYAATAYFLFDRHVIDFEWQIATFLIEKINTILYESEANPEYHPKKGFEERLAAQVTSAINKDKAEFFKKLEIMDDEFTGHPGNFFIFLFPNIYQINILKENGIPEAKYFEFPRFITRDLSEKYVAHFDNGLRTRINHSIEIVTSDELFKKNVPIPSLSGRLWIKIPDGRMGARKIREIYSAAIQRQEEYLGKPFTPKPNDYKDVQVIALIEYNGLFGITKRTANEIIGDEELAYGGIKEFDENTIAQLKRRAIQMNRIGESFKLF